MRIFSFLELFRRDDAQCSKRQRMAPYGSAVATPNAVTGVAAYRSRSGGPALGALQGGVEARR
jgi:hypothetical protein